MIYFLLNIFTISILIASISLVIATDENHTSDDDVVIVQQPRRDNSLPNMQNQSRENSTGYNYLKITYSLLSALCTGISAGELTKLTAYNMTPALHGIAGGLVGASTSLLCTACNYGYLACKKEKTSNADTALCCGSGFTPALVAAITIATNPTYCPHIDVLVIPGILGLLTPPIMKQCLQACKINHPGNTITCCCNDTTSDSPTQGEELRVIIEQPHANNEHQDDYSPGPRKTKSHSI